MNPYLIESIRQGYRAETAFVLAAVEHGWKVRPAPDEADKREHWDYLIHRPGGPNYKVDVKAMKKLRRGDQASQDDYLWVEIRGVNGHDRGWLYDGKADLMAIERPEHFWLIRKADLVKVVERLCNFENLVSDPANALYNVYSREGRDDLITMVRMEDLIPIIWEVWQK